MRIHAAALVAGLALAAPTLAAQRLPVEIGAHVGIVTPDSEYTSECAHLNPALGVEARTRGATFVSASATAYGEGSGSDVACLSGGQGLGVYIHRTGGLDLENALRLGLGVGHRADLGGFSVEVEGTAGATRGRPGYVLLPQPEPAGHRWLPWAGFGVGLTVARHLTLGWEQAWTRLPFRTEIHAWTPAFPGDLPPAPGTGEYELQQRGRWAPMDEVRIGVRL